MKIARITAVTAALVTACGTPEPRPTVGGMEPPPPPPRPPNVAVALGVVLDVEGAAIADAEIWIAWSGPTRRGSPGCEARSETQAVRTSTDASGLYSVRLAGGVGPQYEACVDIAVAAPASASLGEIRRGLLVTFAPLSGGGDPVDSVRADFRLNAR